MRAPVGRFVGAVAVIATVLVVAAWTGAAAPAVQARPMGEGTSDDGQAGYLLAQLDNAGSLPVDIRSITWSSDGLSDAEVLVGPVDAAPEGTRPFVPFTLAGGEQRTVILRGAITCPLPGQVVTVATDPLVVLAKPAAGPSRTLTFSLALGEQAMERTLPCPPR